MNNEAFPRPISKDNFNKVFYAAGGLQLSCTVTKQARLHMRTAKNQTSLCIRRESSLCAAHVALSSLFSKNLERRIRYDPADIILRYAHMSLC